MSLLTWSWSPFSICALLLLTVCYWRGWQRLRGMVPVVATSARLGEFLGAMLLLMVVFISPFYGLSEYWLAARSLQKIMLCMIVPPLLWLSCPFYCIAWGLPGRWRMALTRTLLRRSFTHRVIKSLTQPGYLWLFFVASFLLWHEPRVVSWSSQSEWAHRFAMGALLTASLLYWWRIVNTGPRLHAPLSAWGGFLYLIGVELPNMFAGVTIAFSRTPLYPYYESMRAAVPEFYTRLPNLGIIEDQMLSGGFIWITGSIVYIFSIIVMLNQMFKREDGMPPLLQFTDDADERTIAPGLEYRVQRNRWRQAGFGKEGGSH